MRLRNRVGGWQTVNVNKDNINVLLCALYPLVHIRISSVIEVRQQVVAGMNYEFTVLGSDTQINVRDVKFLIRIFEQPWTNTIRIDSIEIL
jgi:hypothetical protein